MDNLIKLLNQLKDNKHTPDDQVLENCIGSVNAFIEENEELKQEVSRLSQIIADIRARDARKTCLCRGVK